MKNLLLTLLVLYALIFNVACDKTKAAVNASARIAAQIENLVDQNQKSFDAGLYDKETALRIAQYLKKAIPAAKVFNKSVRELKKTYGKQKPPRSEFNRLAELFYAVESPIRNVLVVYGALSHEQSAFVAQAIAAIREAIAIIRDSFSLVEIQYLEAKPQWQI